MLTGQPKEPENKTRSNAPAGLNLGICLEAGRAHGRRNI